jgi:hypothetical protein
LAGVNSITTLEKSPTTNGMVRTMIAPTIFALERGGSHLPKIRHPGRTFPHSHGRDLGATA